MMDQPTRSRARVPVLLRHRAASCPPSLPHLQCETDLSSRTDELVDASRKRDEIMRKTQQMGTERDMIAMQIEQVKLEKQQKLAQKATATAERDAALVQVRNPPTPRPPQAFPPTMLPRPACDLDRIFATAYLLFAPFCPFLLLYCLSRCQARALSTYASSIPIA